MSADSFLNFNEEEDYSEQVEKCRLAFEKGELMELNFSEEEFDYLLGFFADEYNDELVLELSHIAYMRHPYSSELVVRYSDALIVNKEPEKAVHILEKQLDFDSSNSDVYFLLGRGQLKMGNHELAKDYINYAISLSPEETDEMLSTAALDYIDIGEYNIALDYLTELHRVSPDNISAYNDMAFCLERTKRYEESIQFYEKYLDKEPFNDNVWFNVGTIYATIEKYDKAIEAFDYSLALDPGNASVMYNKAIVYINTEQYDHAAEILKEFIELEPDDIFALLALADSSLKIGQTEESEKYVKMALNIENENPEANACMAYICMIKKDYTEALVYLRKIMGDQSVNYLLLGDDLLISFEKTKLPEFLVYYVVSLYFIKDENKLADAFLTLLGYDEVWQEMLYKIVPALNISKQ